MAARQGSSGCAVTALTAVVVLALATLAGCGLFVMFWGVGEVRPVAVEGPSEPTPPAPAPPEEPAKR